jgi:hypothetical protein
MSFARWVALVAFPHDEFAIAISFDVIPYVLRFMIPFRAENLHRPKKGTAQKGSAS